MFLGKHHFFMIFNTKNILPPFADGRCTGCSRISGANNYTVSRTRGPVLGLNILQNLWSWVLVLMLRRTKSVVGDRDRGLSTWYWWSWVFNIQLSLSMSSLWGTVLFGEPLGLKNPEL